MTTLLHTSEAAELLGIHRATLDRITKAAPANLPGAPIQVGCGRTRRHLRYPSETLIEWFRAASDAVNATADLPPANRPGPVPQRGQSKRPTRLRDLTR